MVRCNSLCKLVVCHCRHAALLDRRHSRHSVNKLLSHVHSVVNTSYSVAEERLAGELQRFSPESGVHAASVLCLPVAVTAVNPTCGLIDRSPDIIAHRRMLLNGLAQLAAAAGYVPMSRSEAHVRRIAWMCWSMAW